MKMTAGCLARATPKSARTSFSPSPIHLDMSDEAEMLRKVDDESVAMAWVHVAGGWGPWG